MGSEAVTFLSDGQPAFLPVPPRTWIDAGPGVMGDALRAPLVELDAGGAVAWHRERPIFQAIQSLAQSIPANAWTAISPLAELVDNYAGHSDSGNPSRYYVPLTQSNTTGGDWYLASGYVPFNISGATANDFVAGLRVSGGTVAEGGRIPGGAGHVVDTMVVDLVQANGSNNDYIELCADHNAASAVNTLVSGKSPSLTVRWVCVDQAWSGAFTPQLPANPHVWSDADQYTGSLTGPGRVPLNAELRDLARFLHNPPIFRATSQGTTQPAIPSGSGLWTSFNLNSKTVDNYGGWNGSAPSRYTVQRPGLYLIAGTAAVAEVSGAGGYRASRLLVNGGTAWPGWSVLPQTTGTTGTSPMAVAVIRMAAGDYVELQLSQTSTAALPVGSGVGNSARMIAVWLAK